METRNDYYDDGRKPWIRPLFISVVVIVLIFISLYFIYKDGNSKLENNLLDAGKEYFDKDNRLNSMAKYECKTVYLNQLKKENSIKNEKLFKPCEENETYVNVCKLSNGKIQYTPVYKCGNRISTKFDMWRAGKEKDLIENKSEARFTFMPQVFTKKAKKYYPNDLGRSNAVKELYLDSPDKEYIYRDLGVQASKWYTEETGTTYWKDGDYSSTQPEGYSKKGKEGTPSTSISFEKPKEETYRTIKKVTLYRQKSSTIPYIKNYVCIDNRYSGFIESTIRCENRDADNYKVIGHINYTCDGTNIVKKSDTCPTKVITDWSVIKCNESDKVSCETKEGYSYTDKRWQWYNEGTYKKYYPSGTTSKDMEKTYYVTSPLLGAKEDKTTTRKVYKYFKLGEEDNTSVGEWINISNDYLFEREMILLFQQETYKVETMNDIEQNDSIKFLVELEYRNRK